MFLGNTWTVEKLGAAYDKSNAKQTGSSFT